MRSGGTSINALGHGIDCKECRGTAVRREPGETRLGQDEPIIIIRDAGKILYL